MPNLDMITGNMGNARALAEQLRQMGRGKDTMLAHITPEEADMLLQAGGSGSINPQTGLPEFQPTYDYEYEAYGPAADRAPSPAMESVNYDFGYGDAPTPEMQRFQQQMPSLDAFINRPGFTPDYSSFRTPVGVDGGIPPSQTTPELRFNRPLRTDPFAFVPGVEGTREVYGGEQPGLLSRIEGAGRKFEQFAAANPATTRLGTAGLNLGLTALLARRAGREREAYANELRGMAQPYAQAQQEALARAQGGGMTAPQQRAFDIAQARARQGLSAQNLGAGSAAAGIQTAQSQRARTLARQESFESAMDAARIRDSYLREAARQELAADTDLANALIGVLQGEIREATTTQAFAPQQQRRA
jgi:hypothetical protein